LRNRQPEREKRGKRGRSIDPSGYDAGKKIKGKKRHILVDTLGLLLHAVVHPADIQDRTAACLFSPLCSVCIRFCKSSLLMADIRARSFNRLQPKSCRICKSKSSNAPIRQKGSSFCRDVGLSNALSLGLIAAAGWPRISKISPETRSLFSASPRFVSCSESFV